jgi:hypothetical protein
MPIRKQEFYEGAALHLLARTGGIKSILYKPPFFLINDNLSVLLKYSTKTRSPWGFTFTPDEQLLLQNKSSGCKTVIGLVCGSDGVAAFTYDSYLTIALPRKAAVHVACYRQHREHYEVNGPEGTLDGKISPSCWLNILER